MKDILQEIVAHKAQELELAKRITPPAALLEAAQHCLRTPISMRQALECSATGIIAEFKRRSPSKGWIKADADCACIVGGYAAAGAAACSVLIDRPYFGGSLDDLRTARSAAPRTPLLYKEFIIDPYQLYQARLAGADAVLLIAACLSPDRCAALAAQAHALGLEVLLEIHAVEELACLNENVAMLGVNNRHLGTFRTDTNLSFALAQAMRSRSAALLHQPLLISESGISGAETAVALRKVGFCGFLMGETFMKTVDPAVALSNFIAQMR